MYVIANTLAKLVDVGCRSTNALGLFTGNVVHCAHCTCCAKPFIRPVYIIQVIYVCSAWTCMQTNVHTHTHYVSVPMYLQNVHYLLRCSCPLHEAMMALELSAIENDRDKQMAV